MFKKIQFNSIKEQSSYILLAEAAEPLGESIALGRALAVLLHVESCHLNMPTVCLESSTQHCSQWCSASIELSTGFCIKQRKMLSLGGEGQENTT